MRKYTEKLHVYRLKSMLYRHEGKKSMDNVCPAQHGFLVKEDRESDCRVFYANPPCPVCLSFIMNEKDAGACPCGQFGQEKAIEITKSKIKEWEEEHGKNNQVWGE